MELWNCGIVVVAVVTEESPELRLLISKMNWHIELATCHLRKKSNVLTEDKQIVTKD